MKLNHAPTQVAAPQDLSFLWLEITEKCNLECMHCYADSSPRQELFGQMKTQNWLNVLHESASLGCNQVQFIGGEPMLHPDLPKMIRFASACGYSLIEVFTNATICDDSLIETLVENRVAITTSFYSDDPRTHDQITTHEGSFTRTVSNIREFLTAGLIVRAGIIEMPANAGHAKRATDFLRLLGVSDINIDLRRRVGRGEGECFVSLDPFSELCGQCWKGKLCVTSLGRVYPCVFSRFADLGDVRAGIAAILKRPALHEFRTHLRTKRHAPESHRDSILDRAADVSMHDMYVCSPDLCAPKGSDKCMPYLSCSPDTRCQPSAGPCAPDRRCAPDTRCGPTVRQVGV